MDRFGRLWSALPSMIGLGLGHLALALVVDRGRGRASSAGRLVRGRRDRDVAGERHRQRHPHDVRRRPRAEARPGSVPRRLPVHRRRGNAAAPLALSALTAAGLALPSRRPRSASSGCSAPGLLARWVPRFIPRSPRWLRAADPPQRNRAAALEVTDTASPSGSSGLDERRTPHRVQPTVALRPSVVPPRVTRGPPGSPGAASPRAVDDGADLGRGEPAAPPRPPARSRRRPGTTPHRRARRRPRR